MTDKLTKALPGEDEAVEIMLNGHVPGGSHCKDWLPMEDDAATPTENARWVMRAAYRALVAATPQPQPVTREELAQVVAQPSHDCYKDRWRIADAILSQFNVTRK